MKKIIDIHTNKEVVFSKSDLPVIIHGREGSGASLLSITISALLHKEGEKLLIFTAYPMAKEEFLSQIDDSSKVFYLENVDDIEKASTYQTIIVQSGNMELFKETFSRLKDISQRIIFIKNIETIKDFKILDIINNHNLLIISGDLDLSIFKEELRSINYKAKILFNSWSGGDDLDFTKLLKYQAFFINNLTSKVISMV